MNLYKLATGITTNDIETNKEKKKTKKKDIFNNIGSKKQKLKIVEDKIYDKNKKNKLLNINIENNNDEDVDNDKIIKQKEKIEILKEQLNIPNLDNKQKGIIQSNLTKANNKLLVLQNKQNKK